ncbi:MAG: radical SAM family heme chaperone HemW [Gammaproteobacteria bacterium]|nr:radical SAM family heme chaperone HemW [Gammaproteobacteria bacterium]
MFNFTATPPLSLYVHIPWCVRKCPYCDFNSHALKDDIPEQAYVNALLADLEHDLPAVWGRAVDTVFIGGGTPSLFSPDAIDRLLCGIRARITLDPAAEITLEANPGTVDREHFRGFREAGVNRLSIGVQSFQSDLLEKIGRIHDGREAIRAAEAAHDTGFENFNLDLMFGLPGQSSAQVNADLHTAIDLEPAHISWYELTIEPNTWFHRHPPQRPDDDTLWDMQATGQRVLGEHGFSRYEVSAYARPGKQCRHNLNYWQFGDYLGIGAGAHGKITDAAQQRILRTAKTRHPDRYLEMAGHDTCTSTTASLSTHDAVLEYVMNALRLDGGFSREAFATNTGLPFSITEGPVARALDDGLLIEQGTQLLASEHGQRYLNELLQYWMQEETIDAGTY